MRKVLMISEKNWMSPYHIKKLAIVHVFPLFNPIQNISCKNNKISLNLHISMHTKDITNLHFHAYLQTSDK